MKTNNWESDFNGECGLCDLQFNSEYEIVVNFIQSLLDKQKEEIIKILQGEKVAHTEAMLNMYSSTISTMFEANMSELLDKVIKQIKDV